VTGSFRDFGPADEGRLPPPGIDRRDVIMGDFVHGDKYGGDRVHGDKIVHDGRPPPVRRRTILVMSANPVGQQSLRLDEERRAIDRAVSPAGDRLEVRTADAVRLDDLQPALLRHRPVIAHFSGHGSASAGILVVDDDGRARPVPPDALIELFRILSRHVRCVVLNACYTDEQARAIVAHVPCVVGMHHRVPDRTAIRFAAAFYEGIAYGESVRVAFELGLNSLRLHGDPDTDIPRLLATPGAADRPFPP
jgi:hypothetical protein